MSLPLIEPDLNETSTPDGGWMVVIFNNDENSMDEVIAVLMLATECNYEEAYAEMWEAHTFGKASVHYAGREKCDDVASIIRRIGVRTEVTREWPD